MVLESIATSPTATIANIRTDCVGHAFSQHAVDAMVWQIRREGLVGRSDTDTYFITQAGLSYMQSTDFTRELPEYAPRPKARRPKKHRIIKSR